VEILTLSAKFMLHWTQFNFAVYRVSGVGLSSVRLLQLVCTDVIELFAFQGC